jgi:hypothetical protein
MAVTVTTVPLLYHPAGGEIVPPPDGLTAVLREYCCTGVTLRNR